MISAEQNKFYVILGYRIREARIKANLKQETFATFLSLSRASIVNIEKGIQTLAQIKKEGIAAYAGGHPCNQVACGVYVTLGGVVLRCPGDDITVFGDIREKSLKDIWINCENYKRTGTFNCGCPPKMGKSILNGFFEEVLTNLKKEIIIIQPKHH